VRTLEQYRAENALGRVTELATQVDDFKKRYRAYVERLGPAIVMNGLGQALATEKAASGTSDEGQAHEGLYSGMHRWLCRPQGGVYPGAEDVLQAIVSHDESHYLRAQAEALAWLEWHKKFCRAQFPRAEQVE